MKESIEGGLKLASKLQKPWHIITVIAVVLLSGLAAVFFAKGPRFNSPDISQHIENINILPPSSIEDGLPGNKKIANMQHPKIVVESDNWLGKKTTAAAISDLDAVNDKSNELIWQKNIETKALPWPKAQEYCKNLELGGYTDWRLPTIGELESLVDKRYGPSINPSFGPVPDDYPPYFWSSTIDPNDNNEAQYLNFSDGLPAHINKKDGHGYVLCVRQG